VAGLSLWLLARFVEHTLQPGNMFLGLLTVFMDRLLQIAIGCFLSHFRQRMNQLLLAVVDKP
jgi:hypothetical protein